VDSRFDLSIYFHRRFARIIRRRICIKDCLGVFISGAFGVFISGASALSLHIRIGPCLSEPRTTVGCAASPGRVSPSRPARPSRAQGASGNPLRSAFRAVQSHHLPPPGLDIIMTSWHRDVATHNLESYRESRTTWLCSVRHHDWGTRSTPTGRRNLNTCHGPAGWAVDSRLRPRLISR
jgi:hypothetical protein